MCFTIFLKEKKPFWKIKTKRPNIRKLRFFQGGYSILLVKIWQCLHLFILRNIGQENKFHPILRGKNTFLEYKNNKSKKSKDWDFSKENVHGFGQNFAMLTSLNSKQNRPRKCVL